MLVPPPAAAQNFFDLLFGGFRRLAPQPPPPPGAAPYGAPSPYGEPYLDTPDGLRPEPGGPAAAYCVRTCDGRFFPIRAGNPAEVCSALCPAAQTKIFSGSRIDYAVAHDGRSYRDLPTAFLYREKLVEGCTCNGRTPFGLARLDVKDDPTLRPGDIVATSKGMMQATGRRHGEFMPVSGEMRRRLSDVKIAPAHDSEAGDDIPGYDEFRQSRTVKELRPQAR